MFIDKIFPVGNDENLQKIVRPLARLFDCYIQCEKKKESGMVCTFYAFGTLKAFSEYEKTGDADKFRDNVEDIIYEKTGKNYIPPEIGYLPPVSLHKYKLGDRVIYNKQDLTVVTRNVSNNIPYVTVMPTDGTNLKLHLKESEVVPASKSKKKKK
jgi:hypothetical protein